MKTSPGNEKERFFKMFRVKVDEYAKGIGCMTSYSDEVETFAEAQNIMKVVANAMGEKTFSINMEIEKV